MKISVIGLGYVGLSNAILLATKHKVLCIDIDKNKLESIKNKTSPIKDNLISKYLMTKKLDIEINNNIDKSVLNSTFIIVATPTNFDTKKKSFDVSTINKIVKKLDELKIKSPIIIKSTIPIGYVNRLNQKYKKLKIYFSPEFLREGHSLYDNLYPSRIIIGNKDQYSMKYAKLLSECSKKNNVEIIYMKSTEAETVKLFANSYLATRVSFFNELDSFAIKNNLDSNAIIHGISSDPRIGHGYNNPSFGFGGYCLPKDTKQLTYSFKDVPNALIKSIGVSNNSRKKFISEHILSFKAKTIGIYRITMKKDSDNYRESSTIDIIKILKRNNKKVIIYEPILDDNKVLDCPVIKDIKLFKATSDLIISNRMSIKLKDVIDKVYTRDIFGEN